MTQAPTEYKTPYETTWRARYREYLRSPEWRAQRERVLRRDGYQCQGCQGIPATQAHHTTYRFGKNTPDYLIVSLCDPCHERITLLERGDLKPWNF